MKKTKRIRDARRSLPSGNGFMRLQPAPYLTLVNQLGPCGRQPTKPLTSLTDKTVEFLTSTSDLPNLPSCTVC